MYVDAQNLFSDAQAVTSDVASTNLIDLKAVRDMGTGQDIYVVVLVDVAMSDGSSNSTTTVTIETDDADTFGSATTVQTIGTFPALSAAGTVLVAKLQPSSSWERYIRLKYTHTNGDLSTGSFTAFLTTDIHKWVAYAKGYIIS